MNTPSSLDERLSASSSRDDSSPDTSASSKGVGKQAAQPPRDGSKEEGRRGLKSRKRRSDAATTTATTTNNNRRDEQKKRIISCVIALPIQVSAFIRRQGPTNSAVLYFPLDEIGLTSVFGKSSPFSDLFSGQLQIDLGILSCQERHVQLVADIFTEIFGRAASVGNLLFTVGQYSVTRVGGNRRQTSHHRRGIARLVDNENGAADGNRGLTAYLHACPQTPRDSESLDLLKRLFHSFVSICMQQLPDIEMDTKESFFCGGDKIIVRRFADQPPSAVTNKSSKSEREATCALVDKFALSDVEVSEIRLLFSKGGRESPEATCRTDPRFEPELISCRPILLTSGGQLARVTFGRPAHLPKVLTAAAPSESDMARYRVWHYAALQNAPAARRRIKMHQVKQTPPTRTRSQQQQQDQQQRDLQQRDQQQRDLQQQDQQQQQQQQQHQQHQQDQQQLQTPAPLQSDLLAQFRAAYDAANAEEQLLEQDQESLFGRLETEQLQQLLQLHQQQQQLQTQLELLQQQQLPQQRLPDASPRLDWTEEPWQSSSFIPGRADEISAPPPGLYGFPLDAPAPGLEEAPFLSNLLNFLPAEDR